MARHNEEQPEKPCQRAEELFDAGHVRAAHRDKALAAYEVHATAGGGGGGAGAPSSASAVPPRRTPSRRSTGGCRSSSTRTRPRAAPPRAPSKAAAPDVEEALSKAVSDRDTSPSPWRPAAPPTPVMQPMCYMPREPILIYCPICKNEYKAKIGRLE
ncbi:unnamed protein product [Urochloa humidicola]